MPLITIKIFAVINIIDSSMRIEISVAAWWVHREVGFRFLEKFTKYRMTGHQQNIIYS